MRLCTAYIVNSKTVWAFTTVVFHSWRHPGVSKGTVYAYCMLCICYTPAQYAKYRKQGTIRPCWGHLNLFLFVRVKVVLLVVYSNTLIRCCSNMQYLLIYNIETCAFWSLPTTNLLQCQYCTQLRQPGPKYRCLVNLVSASWAKSTSALSCLCLQYSSKLRPWITLK